MKQSIQTLIKIVLIILLVSALSIYFLPIFSKEIPRDILNPPYQKDGNNNEDVAVTEIKLQHPDEIAIMFGWKKPTPTPRPKITPEPTATPVPTPITPGWLKLIGKYVENNKQYYIFKNEMYNTTFNVAKGVSDKGWSFTMETSDGYYLKFEGKEYFVHK